MIKTEKVRDRVILTAVCTGSEEDTVISLDELEELAQTAGAEVVSRMFQNRESPDPATYLGKGKIEELRELLFMTDANGIICDDELTPAQMNNLQDQLECKVLDRTLLILDIFAQRARTSEGKIQVEMAQLRYRQARLTGLGRSLSRLGGGIGTRGPGEKKLEMDRRLIQERIGALRRELEDVRKHRDVIRSARKKGRLKSAALVGYTNAGKSTLLNALTDAGVLEEDGLFATLDPTTRILDLPGGSQILLTDTVGFIRKLPHNLIEAFKSTLEEAAYADIIVHVADVSNPNVEMQMQVVYETLHELKADDKPIVTLYNKVDKLSEPVNLHDFHADYSLNISARHKTGLDRFREVLEEILLSEEILIERVLPYTDGGTVSLIRQYGQILSEEYLPEGIRIKAYVPKELYGKVMV